MNARLAGWLALVGFLAAISYAGRVEGRKPPKDVLYQYSTAVGAALQYAIMLALVLWIAKGLPKREALALRPPESWNAAGARSVGGFAAVFVGGGLLLYLLGGGGEQGLTPDAWDPSRAGAYAANFVTVAVVAPVVEELTYRGIGFSLLAGYGFWPAAAVTAAAFAAAHGLVLAFPTLFLFGLVTAWLRSSTRSIAPPMLVHAAFNATSLILAVAV